MWLSLPWQNHCLMADLMWLQWLEMTEQQQVLPKISRPRQIGPQTNHVTPLLRASSR